MAALSRSYLFILPYLMPASLLVAPSVCYGQPNDAIAGASSAAVLSPSQVPSSGRIAVNVAAGNGNQEANVAIIAVGDRVSAPAALHQKTFGDVASSKATSARIADDALAGSTGLIAVNVAAGNGNQLANLAVIAIGIEAPAAAEPLLDQSRASQQPPGSPGGLPSPEAEVDLSSSAFAGSTGLVQANVVGGERNSSSNTFVLTVQGGE